MIALHFYLCSLHVDLNVDTINCSKSLSSFVDMTESKHRSPIIRTRNGIFFSFQWMSDSVFCVCNFYPPFVAFSPLAVPQSAIPPFPPRLGRLALYGRAVPLLSL